jgi:hypothetical protein
MKIALNYRHQGLGNQMLEMLSDHEVVDYSRLPDNAQIHEEILISCVSHNDLPYIPDTLKVILYATDGMAPEKVALFKNFQKRPLTRVVIDEDAMLFADKTLYPIERIDGVIPLVINPEKMPKFKGTIKKIAICNKKPEARWDMLSYGLWGKTNLLSDFLKDVPYDIVHIQDYKLFYETISQYSGAFFFSHSQNCLMLYELMTMNMPIVGFDFSLTDNPGIIVKKYLHNYSTNQKQITTMLNNLIAHPKPEYYHQMPFTEAKARWNKAIKELHET